MELTLECSKRPEGSKANALRRSGFIPAVLYGHNGTDSISLTVEAKTVETLLREAKVNNTLIDLKIADGWSGKTLLREVQSHAWKGFPYHLSFFAVSSQDSLEIELALNFVGTATGVKNDGGILDPILTQLAVRCKPDSIPESIDIDVSGMEIGDALHVNELNLPEGVTPVGELDRVVVTVIRPAGGPETPAAS
ncbi:MAG TPA: 50S ribosomal protein L25/general stress protein Ctc [Halomicronema sp.]